MTPALRSLPLFLAMSACTPAPVCLGREALCERRLDGVTIAAAHNAMASEEEGWIAPNQHRAVARQLEDGVRGFLLDTYEEEGEVVLCHGFCELGITPLAETLATLRAFLDEHPGEVIWLVLQDGASPESTVAVFEAEGLDGYAATLDPSEAMPTLGALTEAGTPLIVSTEGDRRDEAPAWYHWAYDLAWDNDYSARTVDDFDCEVLRGRRRNPLFLLNHFLTAPIASPDLAAEANPLAVIREHVERCETESGATVNAIAVDFYDVGGVLPFVRERLDALE